MHARFLKASAQLIEPVRGVGKITFAGMDQRDAGPCLQPWVMLSILIINHIAKAASMTRKTIHTDRAPAAIGPYSQAVRHGNTVYLSGQIPLDASNGKLIEGDIAAQARQVFANLTAVCEAAGGNLRDVVRVGIYVTDLGDFATVNEIMADFFSEPWPARATIEVSALPKGALVEVDAIMVVKE